MLSFLQHPKITLDFGEKFLLTIVVDRTTTTVNLSHLKKSSKEHQKIIGKRKIFASNVNLFQSSVDFQPSMSQFSCDDNKEKLQKNKKSIGKQKKIYEFENIKQQNDYCCVFDNRFDCRLSSVVHRAEKVLQIC
jgi:hypothetical protein